MSTSVASGGSGALGKRAGAAWSGLLDGRPAGVAVRIAACLAGIAVWQVASIYRGDFLVNFQNIPSPDQVARASVDLLRSPKLFLHIGNSLRRVFPGFGPPAVLGVALGLVIGRSRPAE